MRRDPVFVLVGPSASGKSTIAQMLVERQGMRRAITTTTRHQRRGEPFDAYHFVKFSEFHTEDMVEYKDYAKNRYGLTKSEADVSNLVIMEPVGAQRLQVYCKERGVSATSSACRSLKRSKLSEWCSVEILRV